MPFPAVPIVGTIKFAFGANLAADPSTWVYVDCTADWLTGRDLSTTIGGADATNKAQTAKQIFWLKNPHGDYTKGNPMGGHWPYIRKNTPCQVTLDPGTGSVQQYEMYVTQWIPRWGSDGASGRQPLVQVVANGVRRRLTKGASPLRSALYRLLTTTNPISYWPLEDGVDSTQAASGITGGAPMVVAANVMDFIDAGPVGSAGAAKPVASASNNLDGPITGGSSTSWQMSIWSRGVPVDPAGTAYFVPLEVRTDNGKIYRFGQQHLAPDTGFVARYEAEADTTPSNVTSTSTDNLFDGNWHLLQASFAQVGADIAVKLWVDGTLISSPTWTGLTLGRPVRATSIGRFGGASPTVSANVTDLAVSTIAVHNTATLVDQYQAGLGYAGETVADRLTRLGAEQGVAMVVSAGATTRMGPQKPGPFMGLLDECQDADGGILLDGLSPGFMYLARADAYNLPVALTLDMANRQFKAPFEPLDDDSNVVNDETVTRTGGSSARYIDEDGPAGVDAIERYDDGKTLNLASDADLPAQASWRTHVGTAGADALRFPGIGFDLHTIAGSALIEPWLTSGVRKRVQALHPPAEYGPGPIDLLVEGYTETVRNRRVWTVAANASPYDPWRVFVVNTDRVDGDGYKLAVGVNATAVSLSVTSTTGLLWVTTATDPGEFPFDIEVAGIRLRVTGISGTSSPQTFTVTRSMDGFDKALPANSPVRLWKPAAIAL